MKRTIVLPAPENSPSEQAPDLSQTALRAFSSGDLPMEAWEKLIGAISFTAEDREFLKQELFAGYAEAKKEGREEYYLTTKRMFLERMRPDVVSTSETSPGVLQQVMIAVAGAVSGSALTAFLTHFTS